MTLRICKLLPKTLSNLHKQQSFCSDSLGRCLMGESSPRCILISVWVLLNASCVSRQPSLPPLALWPQPAPVPRPSPLTYGQHQSSIVPTHYKPKPSRDTAESMTLILLPTPPSSAGDESKKKGQGERPICPPHILLATDRCHPHLVHAILDVLSHASHLYSHSSLASTHCNPVLSYHTLRVVSRRYTNGGGGGKMPFPSLPGLTRYLGMVALTADYWIDPRTAFMTSDTPEPTKMPHIIYTIGLCLVQMSGPLLS